MRLDPMSLVAAGCVFAGGLCAASETNILSFAYSVSVAAHASTPDTWGRKLNDGYWTNSVTDGVRYDGDVIVTIDLGRRTRLTRVDVRTFTVGGGAPLSTQGVTLECSNDSAAWIGLGALSAASNGLFSGNAFFANPRYIRLICAKGSAATGQSLAEIVVAGSPPGMSSLAGFSYTYSMPSHTAHSDYTFVKMTNGIWNSAATQSVQFGPSTVGAVVPSDPTNSVASNVVVVATMSSVRRLRSAHLYAYYAAGSYVTARVTVSNSLDGVNWSCAGQQTVYESLPAACVRFDFILPNVEAKYLAFACEKQVSASFARQLLAEAQIVETTAPVLGEPVPYTYEVNMASTSSHDNSQCPKLTDGTWEHVTRNAIRYYGDPVITADLGAPMYVAGTDLLCWSNEFQAGGTYYGTGRVVVNGSLDKTSWTELAEITAWKPSFPYNHAVTFTNLPYARYLRFDTYRCESAEQDFTAQILGELVICRPPAAVIGALPVEAPGAIPFAGFETDPLLPDATLVQGGETNGWTFSYTDAANYAGYQINRSPVSTNISTTHYYAPEGVQTAVLMGSGSMEAEISAPTNGTYALEMKVNSTVYGAGENGGYDFRVRLDGADMGVETVLQLTNTMHQVLLRDIAAGTHTLRFEGVNSKGVAWGALIDDLKLKRYEVNAAQVAEQGRGFVFVADSMTPLALDYDGALVVKEVWLGGALASPSVYSALTDPTIFEGPGAVRYDRGTLIQIR
jgi:hypothetical protein